MSNMMFSQIVRTLRGRWLLCLSTFLLVVSTGIALTAMMSKKFTATTSILLDFRGVDPVSGANQPSQLLTGYLATQLDVISSRNVALKVVDALGIDKVMDVQRAFMLETEGRGSLREWVADLLLKNLKLEPSRESSVVKLSYTSHDPRFSAAVANAFAQAYMRTNLELKVDPARETSAWFDNQLKTLKTNLETTQAKLSEFQQRHGIVANDERVDAENSRLQDLTSQLVQAQAQTYDGQSKLKQITEARSRKDFNSAPDVMSNPVIQRMKSEAAQIEARLSDLSTRLDVNHPRYRSNLDQLQSLNRQLDAEMRTIAGTVNNVTSLAQQRESSIRGALEAQKARLLEIKKQRADMVVLQGEAESAQRAYDAGLQRLTQTRLESQLSQTSVAVVTPAVEPLDPSRPRWALNILLAVIIGANAAVGLALMREMSDRRIRSVSDLFDVLPAPLLGELMPAGVQSRRFALLPTRLPLLNR